MGFHELKYIVSTGYRKICNLVVFIRRSTRPGSRATVRASISFWSNTFPPPQIKIATKSSHPKIPVPTQTKPTIWKISTPLKILRSYPSLEIRSTPLGSLPVYLLPLCGYPGQVRVTLFQAPRSRARGRGDKIFPPPPPFLDHAGSLCSFHFRDVLTIREPSKG